MNIKEILINEIEVPHIFLEESVSALLHTILFVRAPNFIKPVDYKCKYLAPLIFAKCGPEDVDRTVDDTIAVLSKVRVPLSPGRYGGILNVSFFEMKTRKAFLGFQSYQEKVYFERWKIPVIINENDYLSSEGSITAMTVISTLSSDAQYSQPPWNTMNQEVLLKIGVIEVIRTMIQQRIAAILEAGSSIDHVPFSTYEYDIEVNGMDSITSTTMNNARSTSI